MASLALDVPGKSLRLIASLEVRSQHAQQDSEAVKSSSSKVPQENGFATYQSQPSPNESRASYSASQPVVQESTVTSDAHCLQSLFASKSSSS